MLSILSFGAGRVLCFFSSPRRTDRLVFLLLPSSAVQGEDLGMFPAAGWRYTCHADQSFFFFSFSEDGPVVPSLSFRGRRL